MPLPGSAALPAYRIIEKLKQDFAAEKALLIAGSAWAPLRRSARNTSMTNWAVHSTGPSASCPNTTRRGPRCISFGPFAMRLPMPPARASSL